MKVVVFYVSLMLILLSGANAVHAASPDQRADHASNAHIPKGKTIKITNADHGNFAIDDADSELDDEHLKSQDDHDGFSNNLLAREFSLPSLGYLKFALLSIAEHYDKRFNTFPKSCGNSSPIYIKQRVLRI
jgi:hypothetical protein